MAATKPLEQMVGSLFERDELPASEVVDGCLRALITAHDRLTVVLEGGTPSSALLLVQARISAEKIARALEAAHRTRVDGNWRK